VAHSRGENLERAARIQDPNLREAFRLGEWLVRPDDGSLRSGESVRRLEPQVMGLLVYLASRVGEVVSRQDILEAVWHGRLVSEDALTGSISQIRSALGDEARVPRYVETLPKRGYRLLVPVQPADAATVTAPAPSMMRHRWSLAVVVVVLVLAVASSRRTRVPAEAMEIYLRGRTALSERTPEALQQAQVYFRRATELDPRLAVAFSGLADSQTFMASGGLAPLAETAPQARDASLRALALDPNLAEAHASYGMVLAFLDLDTVAGERELRRAVELQPDLQSAQRAYALLLSVLGRHDEAIDHARKSLSLDPLSVPAHIDLAFVLIAARRFDAAIRQMTEALALDPASATAHGTLASAYWFLGKAPEGYAAHRKAMQLSGVTDEAVEYMDGVYRREGLRGVCRVEAEYAASQAVQNPSTRMETVIDYGCAGELDRAFKILEQHYASLRPSLILVSQTPYLDPLRSDPRFSELVEPLPRPRAEPSSH
jgi:DNA-binding winged helix-turn-helix (wHTH) protein/tetratricopeptide (TPR) repeat protein